PTTERLAASTRNRSCRETPLPGSWTAPPAPSPSSPGSRSARHGRSARRRPRRCAPWSCHISLQSVLNLSERPARQGDVYRQLGVAGPLALRLALAPRPQKLSKLFLACHQRVAADVVD